MKDERLIRALGGLEREEDAPLRGDPRWEALARGELSPADAAALRAEAGRDAESQAALDALTPLDDSELDRLADGVEDVMVSSRGESGPSPSARAPAADARAPVVPISHVAPPPPVSRTGWAAGVLATIALAAGLAFVFRAQPPGLPAYELALAGGDQELRAPSPAGAAGLPRVHAGSTLDLVARPEHAVAGPVEARAFVAREGRLTPIAAPLSQSTDGAFRLRGTREALFAGASGTIEIVIVVAPSGALPSSTATLRELEGGAAQVLRRSVELVP
jgi:hypothetical protein